MSLAGLDPSGGAGLLADIKTFESLNQHGFGVCTALTVQTDDAFLHVDWLPASKIIAQAIPLLEKFPVKYCKIGIISHPAVLLEVLTAFRAIRPEIRFVLDPVLKASAGHVFHTTPAEQWAAVLPMIDLLTPNYDEAIAMSAENDAEKGAQKLSAHCAVLLKGGHRADKKGVDTLYTANGYTDFKPTSDPASPKHGSGCVLSAAITAWLAKGVDLATACRAGKDYTLRYLKSSPSLFGQH